MKYTEWRDELKANLLSVPESERRRVLDYYAEAYADRRDAGFSEREIIEEFGAPYDAAQRILAENRAEPFEEQFDGFSDGKRRTDKQKRVPEEKTEKPERHENNGGVNPIFVIVGIILCIPLCGVGFGLIIATVSVCAAPFGIMIYGFSVVGGSVGTMVSGAVVSGLFDLGAGLIIIGVSFILFPLFVKVVSLIWKIFKTIWKSVRSLLRGRENA